MHQLAQSAGFGDAFQRAIREKRSDYELHNVFVDFVKPKVQKLYAAEQQMNADLNDILASTTSQEATTRGRGGRGRGRRGRA